ncbi:MAG: CRISPR system precrRNA processing endoribonuclease RAMP protein Cas6 [Bacteroidota bacterium]
MMSTIPSHTDLLALQTLQWQEVKLIYEVGRSGELPSMKGSAWRGMFGHILKDYAPDLYNQIFECKVPTDHPMARRYAQAPNPYVVFVPSRRRTFERGERFQVRLTLIGKAVEALPRLILLLQDMGGMGMGKDELPLSLISVLPEASEPMEMPQEETFDARILFDSPIQLKFKSKAGQGHPLPFSVLAHRLAERCHLLAHFHGEAPFQDRFEEIKERASQVVMVRSSIRPMTQARFSTRTERKTHMKGWVGHVDYAGIPSALFPLLYLGAHLHLGKGTTWGMGKLGYLLGFEG